MEGVFGYVREGGCRTSHATRRPHDPDGRYTRPETSPTGRIAFTPARAPPCAVSSRAPRAARLAPDRPSPHDRHTTSSGTRPAPAHDQHTTVARRAAARSLRTARLHRAENGHVTVSAANHGERLVRREEGGARQRRDRLLTGVDEVGVELSARGEGANSQHPVLRLQLDVDAVGHVVRDERRKADAQVDVVAVT